MWPVDDATAGRAIRVVRLRLKVTQRDLAAACGISQGTISRVERGHLDTGSLRTLRALASRLDMRVQVVLRWRGGELDRLLARKHSALHEAMARFFASLPEWEIHSEVTYSEWGERGTIDILAWHPRRRILLVIELKTDIVDIQDLIGRLDQKVRLGPAIARKRGWDPVAVGVWVVIAPGRTNHRRLAAHAAVLRRAFPADGRRIRSWLRRPDGRIAALSFLPSTHAGSQRRGTASAPRS